MTPWIGLSKPAVTSWQYINWKAGLMRFNRKLDQILKDNKAIFLIMASIVVIFTIYSLIVPAFTLDEQEAKEQGGIEIEEQASTEEGHSASETVQSKAKTEKTAEKNTEAETEAEKAGSDSFVAQKKNAAISAQVITAKEERFRIDVTYDEEAKIPEGAVLTAKEIPEGSEEYEKYLKKTEKKWEKADREEYISFARFFDIEILKDGKKIEPEAPVEVEIVHDDGFVQANDKDISVIHFAEGGTEIIDEIQKNKAGTKIVYEQEGFSVIGTVSTVKDSGWPTSNGQYVLVLQDGDDYYALKQDGTLKKVRYFNNTVSFIGEGTTTTAYINDYLWYVQSNAGVNATGRISDKYYENGSAVEDQMFIVPMPDGWVMNAARQIRFNPTEKKLYYTYQRVSRTLSAHNGELSVVELSDPNSSPMFFAPVSSFTANDNETDLFTQEEVESIVEKWKEQKTKGASFEKTAEVYDYENRIYQVDITASSADFEVSPSIALEFVVDASRSMFFPTKINKCGELNGNNLSAVKSWLNTNGDINKTYFVVNNPNTDATQFAFFYNPYETKYWARINGKWDYTIGDPHGVWEWTDASNYNPPDGQKVIGNYLDRFPYSNLDYNVYETDMLSYKYEEEYGTRGQYISRIEYLKQCVRVASQVIYAVDDKAQIGLVGFNRNITDYGTYGKSEQQTLLSQLDGISLDGGTNQEGGLAMAVSKFTDSANVEKYKDRKHVVVLVTDGAPNYKYTDGDQHQVTWETIGNVADQLKALKDDYGDNTELYTMGLSLADVGENQSGLFGVSSGEGYQYAGEDAAQIINAVTQIVDGIFVQANLVSDVTDVIDPAFYPVNKADGTPLSENEWIRLDGTKVNAGASDAAGQVKKDPSTGNWYVEWMNQSIDWPTTDASGAEVEPGWHGTVFVKAKEDFLGGNGISTNAEGSKLEASGYKVNGEPEVHEFAEPHRYSFETPYVNVDELDVTKNDTEWTVYLGTEVDPLKEVKALWDKVKVREVVSKTDSDQRMSSDGDLTYQYAANTSDNRQEINGREEFPIIDIPGMTLTDADWENLLTGGSKIIEYNAYGHQRVGTIMVSLTPVVKDGEKDLTESPHDTSIVGEEVEKYTLTVSYRPTGANVSNWHTGSYGSGMAGTRAGNIRKENTHIINVYVKGLQITKVDLNDRILTGAKFGLYRTARAGETDVMEIEGSNYHKVANLDTSSSGVAVKEQIEQLEEGEQYYLVETQVPAGYDSISPIPVNLVLTDAYTPKPGETAQTTKPGSGIFDWIQSASLVLDTESGVKRTDADNTVDLTHVAASDTNNEIVYYRITNNPGVELPSAGGPGTHWIYLIGAIMALTSFIGLVVRAKVKKA